MTISQAVLIHELLQHITDLERENGILQHQADDLFRRLQDAQYTISILEPPIDDDDTQRDIPAQAV